MDKEAQEKTADELRVLFGSSYTREEYLASAQLLLSKLEELSYCKLPKDKPPLLGKKFIAEIVEACLAEGVTDYFDNVYRGVEAQREADIKFYEGG